MSVVQHPSTRADDLMSASEHSGAPPAIWIGACAVDCATGQMLVGQWLDDELRSQVGGWARLCVVWLTGGPCWMGWARLCGFG